MAITTTEGKGSIMMVVGEVVMVMVATAMVMTGWSAENPLLLIAKT